MGQQHPGAGRAPATGPGHVATGSGVPSSPRRRTGPALLRAIRPRRSIPATLLAGLLAVVVAIPATASWPVASRASYRSQGYHTGHRANDIVAARGTRILPIRDGRVVFAGWKSNCGGWQVWVSHGNGLFSAYYHLSREASRVGKVVQRQQTTLGYLGTSGCVTGAHLHVEVWRGFPWRSGSHRVNPWPYIDSGSFLPSRYR